MFIRKLFKYSKHYSGKDSQFVEDDVFWTIVPLNDEYLFDIEEKIETKSSSKVSEGKLTAQQNIILRFIKEKGQITSHQAEELLEAK